MAVLDESKVKLRPAFKGREVELRQLTGARILRVVHPGPEQIAQHCHDLPYVGLHNLGAYREEFDGGEIVMSGPSAAFHPAGRPHADQVGERGLETVTIEFDPVWLRGFGPFRPLDRSRCWSGGAAGLAARVLLRVLTNKRASESDIAKSTLRFLWHAGQSELVAAPRWLYTVQRQLAVGTPTLEIAKCLDLHPAWLARAYRAAVGEGMRDTVIRKRIESATAALRRTDRSLADIAYATGFCDQSHMNRCFQAVLGRTPLAVRSEVLT